MDDDLDQPIEQMLDEQEVADIEQEVQEVQPEVKQVPLSALQKERKKRQEVELELQWERQQKTKPVEPVEDNSRFESATKEDLSKSQEEAIRAIEERLWIKQNPEKYEKVNDQLPQFLKQRPNLAQAINLATNRYEEAFTLMEALTPKQQQAMKPSPKKEAPNAPSAVPKGASMNQAVDVMNMSDKEFVEWRQSQKRRR